MGLLIDGVWHDKWYDTKSSNGKFERQESSFRNWVKADGSTPFTPEAGRYRLYVSLACPWAHRTLIMRKLKGLESFVDEIVTVEPLMLENGWMLTPTTPLHTVYTKADKTYTGRVTVPILWDKKTETIVSNESAEIIRMFNAEFGGTGPDYYPAALASDIDEINDFVYNRVNNGVYRAGFATTQEAYEEAFTSLFEALDQLNSRLAENRYLVGDTITEADWRLFTTLVRFDSVYFGHFKCNHKRIVDYPNLWGYAKELYQIDGIAETIHLDQIKAHYYGSHKTINPKGIVPVGPEIDFTAPHGRD